MISADQLAFAGKWTNLDTKLTLSLHSLQALQVLGFDTMTPVQASTIPLFLNHKDVVVEAVTGSGKTLAFVVPIVEILMRMDEHLTKYQVGAVIISPTRELAMQISKVMQLLLPPSLTQMTVTGGRPVEEDIKEFQLNGANILVATPGKLQDIVAKYECVNFKRLEILVLDEADRLLDLGFERSLRAIMQKLPKQRRTGLFSATMTDSLSNLIKAGLRQPVRVVVKVEDLATKTVQRTPSTLSISYLVCDSDAKMQHLIRQLLESPEQKFIIYFATCSCVDYFYKVLSLALSELQPNFPLFSLHGKMDSKIRRPIVYEKFTASVNGALLCTDVAARGLDIPDVDQVIQFDAPQDPQAFLHRCGRTARQGRVGSAVVFLMKHEDTYVEFMKLRKIPMEPHVVDENAVEIIFKPQTMPSLHKHAEEINAQSTWSLSTFIEYQILTDKDMYIKSIVAFVSYLKSYQEHQLKYIFRFQNLDIPSLLRAFMLVKIPKSPELKRCGVITGFESVVGAKEVDMIPFRDKARDKQRLANAKSGPRDTKERVFGKKESWSDHKDLKKRRLERKEKKERKRQAIHLANAQDVPQVKEGKSRVVSKEDADEWAELQRENKVIKKLKAAK